MFSAWGNHKMDFSNYLLLCSIFIPLWISLYYILPYVTSFSSLRHIPGPFIAKLSNTWLAFHSRKGKRYTAIHSAHQKYGTVVRIGYNHISIASELGIPLIYAHGNGFLKDEFYDAFDLVFLVCLIQGIVLNMREEEG